MIIYHPMVFAQLANVFTIRKAIIGSAFLWGVLVT